MVLMRCWKGTPIIAFRLTNSLITRPHISFPTRSIAAATRWRMSTTHEERTASDPRQTRLHDVYVDRITPINEDVRLIRLTAANNQSLGQEYCESVVVLTDF